MGLKEADKRKIKDLSQKQAFLELRDFLYGRWNEYKKVSALTRADYHLHLGKCLTRLGDYTGADSSFNDGLEACPFHKQIKLAQVESYFQRGSMSPAGTILRELEHSVAEDSPPTLRSHLQRCLGRYHKIMGAYDTSLDHYQAALQLSTMVNDPIRNEIGFLHKMTALRDPDPHAGMASYALFLTIQKYDFLPGVENFGIHFLKNIIRDDKDSERQSAAYSILSRIYFDEKNYALSEDCVRRALDLNDQNKHALSNGICLLLVQGRNDDAKDVLLATENLFNEEPHITIRLAYAFRKAGMDNTVFQLLDRAKQHNHNADIAQAVKTIEFSYAKKQDEAESQKPNIVLKPGQCALFAPRF